MHRVLAPRRERRGGLKRTLVIAAAGTSTRFSRSLGREVYKILYHEGPVTDCLLGWQLALARGAGFDRVLIVGGHAYPDLCAFVQRHAGGGPPVATVFNEHYRDRGTCWSFVCGVAALPPDGADEIVFMEGDLMVDAASLAAVAAAERDVVTAARDPIRADKSVAFYRTPDGRLRYIYDPAHRELRVDGPFTLLGNSGQVWKFRDPDRLRRTVAAPGPASHDDTNLAPIMAYFNAGPPDGIDFITFQDWFNCNTVEDYRQVRAYLHKGKTHA